MFTILANGTKSGSYNLDYINDLVKEFGIRVQDGSKGVSEGFGDLSEETQKYGSHSMKVRELQPMFLMLC